MTPLFIKRKVCVYKPKYIQTNVLHRVSRYIKILDLVKRDNS